MAAAAAYKVLLCRYLLVKWSRKVYIYARHSLLYLMEMKSEVVN